MRPPTRRRPRRSDATALILCLGGGLAVTALLLGTALRPGYALFLDHVSVPVPARPDWDYLGTPSGLRAWPLDGVAWLWSLLLPPWLLQHLILAGALVGAGSGAGLVLRRHRPVAMVCAVVLAIANPYVVQRLLLGQAPLLLAYASLPWIIVASRQSSTRRRLALTSVAVLPAALTPWGAVVAGIAAVLATVARRRPGREVVSQAILVIAMWLPWLVPALRGASGGADPSGATAFRLADDVGLGVFASALAGGGVWSEAATLPARLGPLGVAGLVALVVLAALGTTVLLKSGHALAAPVVLVAVAVPLVAALLSGPLLGLWAALQELPGVAMFRDLHRLLAPSVLAMVLLAALGLGSIIERAARGHLALRLPLVVIVPAALALVLVPGGPDRVRSAYEPRPFSSEWPTVMSAVDNGRVLSLPWQPLRRTEWMAQSFLDPSAKALAGRVLVDRTLTIARDGTRIRVVDVEGAGGDDTLGAWLTRGDGDPLPSGLLAGSDIEHVVIWKGSPGAVPARPPDWTTTFSGTDFVVWSDPRAASR